MSHSKIDYDTMSRWDHFAAAALSGVAGLPETGCNSPSDLANWAAQCADAMVRERAKRFSDA